MKMRAQGSRFEHEEIPAELLDEAEEWRGKLVESLAEVDDSLLERYIEDHESITAMRLLAAMRKSAVAGITVPVICGAAFKNKGVQMLLDTVVAFLPSPVDKGAVTGIDPRNDEEDNPSAR